MSPTLHPIKVKEFENIVVIEDDFGFSVRCALTYMPLGSLGFEHIGKTLKIATINKSTVDAGLEYDQAITLATHCQRFFTERVAAKKKKAK